MNRKKLSARILSLALTVAMVFTIVPTTALAADGTPAPLGASNAECHVTHDENCGYKEAVEGADCSHKNEDGTYSCVSVSDNETATPSEATAVCGHTDGCGYSEAVEGVDCTHSCEICKPLDSGNANKPSVLENCSCDILCIEGKINTDCKLCSVEGADLTICKGKDNIAPAEHSAYDKVVELFMALPDALVITSETTEEEKGGVFAQLSAAMDAYDALSAPDKERFDAEQQALWVSAVALSGALYGATPMVMLSSGDTLVLGALDPVTKTFKDAKGTGTGKYQSVIIGFTLSQADQSEGITLPTGITGYAYQPAISSSYANIVTVDGDGKTAGQIATEYISKIVFNGGAAGQSVAITLSFERLTYRTFSWGGNGHFYQYVPFAADNAPENTWLAAYDKAKTMKYNGRTGYLATVTSVEEDLFMREASASIGWLGGTRMEKNYDVTDEDLKGSKTSSALFKPANSSTYSGNSWYWACGPEAGKIFYDVASVTADNWQTVHARNDAQGRYFNWEIQNTQEPNSGTNEAALATLLLTAAQGVEGGGYKTGSGYAWNDLNPTSNTTNGGWASKGFFVEYGDQTDGDSGTGSESGSESGGIGGDADIQAPFPQWLIDAGLTAAGPVEYSGRPVTVKLTGAVTLKKPLVLPANSGVIIDLNGQPLTPPAGQPAIKASAGKVELTLKDSASSSSSTPALVGGNGQPAIDFSLAAAGSKVTLSEKVGVQGGAGGSVGAAGGDGIKGSAQTAIVIGGGAGATGGIGGLGGAGGNGATGGTITIDGVASGGTGGKNSTGTGGNGGIGADGTTINGSGTATGGDGGGGSPNGQGGAGVSKQPEPGSSLNIVNGTEGALKAEIGITGLKAPDTAKVYDGAAIADVDFGTAELTQNWVGTLEYNYYKDSVDDANKLPTAPTNAGQYVLVVAIPSSDATYSGEHAAITFRIAKKPVTVTIDASSNSVTKVYDGTTSAGAGAIALNTSDILATDAGVSVAAGTIPAYSASAVGSSYSLAVPVVLQGDTNNSYEVSANASTVTVTGSITAKPVTVTDGTLAITKEYDGTTSAGTATGVLSSADFVAADSAAVSVKIDTVGTYADTAVGTGKAVTLNVSLDGASAGNYSLANNTYSFTAAAITKATPTVSVTAVKKADSSLRSIIGSKEDTFIITATVTGVNNEKPTGTVQLTASSTSLGSAITLNNGAATYEWAKPSAGTYTITADFTATDNNYNNATGTFEDFDISKAEQAALSFGGAPTTVTYGDSQITFVTTGGSGTGTIAYTSSDTNVITADGTIKGVGAVTITATKPGDNDYTAATATTTITVNAATPTLAWDSSDTTPGVTYTGNAATIPAPKVTLKGSDTNTATIQYAYKSTSLSSSDYTDGLPTDAGEYKIKAHIDAAGNYTAADSTNEVTLTINESTPTVSIKNTYTGKDYDGTPMAAPTAAQMEIAGASYANVTFAYSANANMSASSATAPTNAGTYYVQASIAAGDNTTAATSTAVSFTIAKKAVTATVTSVDKEYDGNNTANITLSVAKVNPTDDITITVTGATYDNKNVGTSKTITVTGTTIDGASKDNYNVTIPTITGEITTKAVTVTATVTTKEYDKTTAATATYMVSGKIGTDAVTAKGTATFDNANVGTDKTVNITGLALLWADSSNYTLSNITATAQGTIAKANVTITIDAITAVDFTGAQIKPAIIVKTSAGTALATTDYTVEYGANVDAGTGTVTVKAATGGNYSFTDVTANFTINKIAYTGTAVTGTKLVVQNTAQAGAEFDLSALSFPAGFQDKTFGAVSYSANTDGVLTGTPSITGTKLTFDVGSVAMNKSGVIGVVVSSKNYNDYTAKITVTTVDKTPVTIGGTVATGLVYSGTAQQGYTAVTVEGNKVPVSELEFTYSGTEKNGTTYAATATAPTKAGDYKLVISVKSSNATYTGTSSDLLFSIGQAPLTIKAKDQFTYQYKGLPATELVYTGFVNGEDKAVLVGASAYAATHTAANTATAGDNFAINVSGSTTNMNYSITTTGGKLKIYAATAPEAPNPAPPTTTVTAPEILAEPDGAKQLRVFSAQLATEEKTEALKQLAVPTGAVTTSQEIELQVSNDNGVTWTKATLADVKNGKVQVVLPIPAGTSPTTHTYKMHHFANGATAPPETLNPTVSVPTNSLTATVASLSPFVVIATPNATSGGGGGSTGGGGSSSETFYYIKATAGIGGSMSTSERVKVRAGESAGFTITPSKGYQIADVRVNGKSIGAKNYYAFTNIQSDQTIHATFKQAGHQNPQTGVGGDDVNKMTGSMMR